VNGSRPLISLALFAYQQEEYVRAAVEAALSQSYSPLEVILSDDASSDRTFEIMCEVVDTYAGPHTIKLNCNERNLGIAGHVNHVAELASGSVVVLAAGDDISLPHRVERIASAFGQGERIMAVLSGYTAIDPAGTELDTVALPADFAPFTELDSLARSGGWVGMGATLAYARECFTTPNPIPGQILCEDRILPFRAALLGRIAFVREPLVRYRVHDRSMSAEASFKSPEYEAKHQRVLADELEWARKSGRIGERLYRKAKRALNRYPNHFQRALRLSSHPIVAKLYSAFYFRDVWVRRIRWRISGR